MKPLQTITNINQYGSKALQLANGLNHGLPIPEGYALPVNTVKAISQGNLKSISILREYYDKINYPLAVRSSAIGEDSADTSFAGQHLTMLNIMDFNHLIQAIKKIYSSAYSENAIIYRKKMNVVGAPQMAIILQKFINPDSAGVLFNKNPSTGSNEIIIEANWGLGESVVAGLVVPDYYKLNMKGQILEKRLGNKHIMVSTQKSGNTHESTLSAAKQQQLCLKDEQLAKLFQLTILCQKVYVGSQDIEWAFVGNELYLLQRRTITKWTDSHINPVKKDQQARQHPLEQIEFLAPGPGLWSQDNTHYPVPITALYTPTLITHYTKGLADGSLRYGVLLKTLKISTVNRFVYTQRIPVSMKDFAKREANAKHALTEKLYIDDLHDWETNIKPDSIKRNLALIAEQNDQLDDNALFSHILACIKNHELMTYRHNYYNIPAFLPIGLCFHFIKQNTDISDHDMVLLLSGASPISTGWIPEVEPLVRAIKKNKNLAKLFFNDSDMQKLYSCLMNDKGEIGKCFKAYVNIIGYRIVGGYDITCPRNLDKPALIIDTIRNFMKEGLRDETPTALTMAEKICSQLDQQQQNEFAVYFQEARKSYHLRDERDLYNDLWAAGILKTALLIAGQRLEKMKTLINAEDILQANRHEVEELLIKKRVDLQDELLARNKFQRQYTYRDAPKTLGNISASHPTTTALPESSLDTVMMAIQTSTGMLADKPKAVVDDNNKDAKILFGLMVCGGTYEGIARVVNSPLDFIRIKQGDILVAPSASPSFNIVLPRVGAVITDHGGLLSHAAIVAREYGLPSLVSCHDATRKISDGDLIRVEADQNRALIIKRSAVNQSPK